MNSDNYGKTDNKESKLIKDILELDAFINRSIRTAWPTSWLQINVPLGATRALLLIEAGNAATPRLVAEQLGVGRTTVTGLLDKLEAEQLITRAIDPHDRRSFILQLTAKGQELVRQIDEIRQLKLSRALGNIDGEALSALHKGLQALTEAMRVEDEKPSVLSTR